MTLCHGPRLSQLFPLETTCLFCIKWPCNQKGFCRNHQLRKLPTRTFQQVIWLSLRCYCATWAVSTLFLSSRLAATCCFVIDLVVLKFDLQILEILWHLLLTLFRFCLNFAGFLRLFSPVSSNFIDWFDLLDWLDWADLFPLNWFWDSAPSSWHIR